MRTMYSIAAAALALASASPMHRIYGYENIKRSLQRQGRSKRTGSFDPIINRHTGEPHEHKREIARRLKQSLKQQARGNS